MLASHMVSNYSSYKVREIDRAEKQTAVVEELQLLLPSFRKGLSSNFKSYMLTFLALYCMGIALDPSKPFKLISWKNTDKLSPISVLERVVHTCRSLIMTLISKLFKNSASILLLCVVGCTISILGTRIYAHVTNRVDTMEKVKMNTGKLQSFSLGLPVSFAFSILLALIVYCRGYILDSSAYNTIQ